MRLVLAQSQLGPGTPQRMNYSMFYLPDFLNNCDQIKMILKFSPLIIIIQLPLISVSSFG